MARVFNGSSQYLSVATSLLTNEPIGMFAWGKTTDTTNSQTVICLGNNGASGHYTTRFSGNTAGDPLTITKISDAAAAGNAVSTTGYSSGVWAASGAAFRSDASRDQYIDGGSKGSNTTNVADPTPDFLTVGALRINAVSQYFNGSIAEAYLFDVDPTDAQHAILANGFHPIYAGIPFSNIRGWYPLLGDDNNRVGGGYPDLTATGSPTFGSHPSQVIPPRLGSRCSF